MKYRIMTFKRIHFDGDWRQEPLKGGVTNYYPGNGACTVAVEPIGEDSIVNIVTATYSIAPGDPFGGNTKLRIVGQVVHLPEVRERAAEK